jgi:glyoxylase-like metal-dependent hydrolase (beta-lactamase superfamily II)
MYHRVITCRRDGGLGYLLGDAAAGEAVAIDPSTGEHALLRGLLAERRVVLRRILCTHLHDVGREWPRLERLAAELGADGVVAGDSPAGPNRADDGANIVFGDQVIHVLATPGHTPGSVSFLWHDRVFCGDALDAERGAAHAWPVDPGELYDSVTRKLFRLPDETLVYPGHRQRGRTVSTIGDERARHPEFARLGRDAYVANCLRRRAAPRGAASRRVVTAAGANGGR